MRRRGSPHRRKPSVRPLPVKDVAAAGGWKDITTLINCYQQPDEETVRSVVEYIRPAPEVSGLKARA